MWGLVIKQMHSWTHQGMVQSKTTAYTVLYSATLGTRLDFISLLFDLNQKVTFSYKTLSSASPAVVWIALCRTGCRMTGKQERMQTNRVTVIIIIIAVIISILVLGRTHPFSYYYIWITLPLLSVLVTSCDHIIIWLPILNLCMRACKCQFTDEASLRLPKHENFCFCILASATNGSIVVSLPSNSGLYCRGQPSSWTGRWSFDRMLLNCC